MNVLAILTIATGVASLLSLSALHIVSPEFKPSWRMISEYALGKHKWMITTFFLLWGTSSLLLSVLLLQKINATEAIQESSPWILVGIGVLVLSAVGEIMGGLFDVKHKLHGLSFLFGVPSVPIAALLISYQLDGSSLLLISAHSTWISLVLMAVAMAVMMSGFQKAGMPMSKDSPPPERVPAGVIALAGYANRLLVFCYVAWLMVAAYGLIYWVE